MEQNKKQTYFSLFLSFISFFVNYSVNFFITPYVSAYLPGTYGYVKIANDVISYASLITIALDSMASRFISLEYNKGNEEKAKKYYCSVMYANIFIAAILSLPMSFTVLNLDKLIQIPIEYIVDIKVLFTFSFISFLLTVCFSANSVATFILNRLDLTYYVEVIVYITRAGLLLLLFTLLPSHVYYIGLTGVVLSIITVIGNEVIKLKIMPSFRLQSSKVSVKMVFEILTAGIWNAIQKLGQILLDGLDLIISNVLISTMAMNDLSFAKTMPAIIASLLTKVSTVFMPNYTILYAQEKMDELKSSIKNSMLILSVVISIPIGILMAFGKEFYIMWIPNENISLIVVLSTLSCFLYVISTPMNAVYNLFTVANKVRPLALVTLASGVISTMIVLFLVKNTSLGVYAVVCCSVIIGIIRNIFFVAPYAAKILGFRKMTFIPEIFKSVLSVTIVCGISYIVKRFINIDGWIMLGGACIITGCCSIVINSLLFLNINQRKQLLIKLRRRQGEHA